MGKTSNVIKLDLNPVRAKQIIAEIIEDSGRVFFTVHAAKRMKERRVTSSQVFRCLRHGGFSENPTKTPKGNWKFTMETFSAGESISVAAALDNDKSGNYIIVITVFIN